LQVSVNRRQLLIFTAVIALFVSVAWVGVANQARAGSATPVVYVATGENFPDALGAGPAAAIVKGPILLVAQNAIPGETAAELSRLAPDKIIIVGGTAVVSASVESSLAAYAPTVERIAGANRYDTAAKLSAATYPATMDADTLNGLSSSAFLATTGKAADSDKLDGKDSSAFVEHGDIVMATDGHNWTTWGSDEPSTLENWMAYTVASTDGPVGIGLTAPASVDGIRYGLESVEVCYEALSPGFITSTYVYGSPADLVVSTLANDGTDRTTDGCYTVTVNTVVPYGAGIGVTLVGGATGFVNLFGVRSTWTPEAYLPVSLAETDSSDDYNNG
jgi:hypothetical protein